MYKKLFILLINNNLNKAKILRKKLKKSLNCEIFIAIDIETSINRIRIQKFDIVLLDFSSESKQTLELLRQVKKINVSSKVILALEEPDESSALLAYKMGAYHVMYKTAYYYKLLPFILQQVLDHSKIEQKLIQKEKLYAIGQLVSGVAHELNNPLLGINGFSKLLLDEIVDEKHKNDIHTIYKESLRCQKIVSDLLNFVRNKKETRVNTNINKVIKSVLELQSMQFKKDNIAISTEYAKNLPKVPLDFHKFQQVILNLIINAYQATSQIYRQSKILIKTSFDSNIIYVKISDNGPGIPEIYLSKIFEPFFSTKESGEGTGLGLSICKDILKDYNGKIYAKNNENYGATFTIELPVYQKITSQLTIINEIENQINYENSESISHNISKIVTN